MTKTVYELEKYLGKFKLFCINPWAFIISSIPELPGFRLLTSIKPTPQFLLFSFISAGPSQFSIPLNNSTIFADAC